MNFSHTTFSDSIEHHGPRRDQLKLGAPPPDWRLQGGHYSAEEAPGYCPRLWQRGIKRSLDIVGALALLALLGPMYLGIALAVALRMGAPVHYWQKRLGRGGKAFPFYKFRSMCLDADAMLKRHLAANPDARLQWRRYQKLEDDPRITPLGRFLRRTSLDELPQLFNVLKGDMSLVGPRPCMERQRSLYGPHWSRYCDMRPGITGLWQVSGRNRLTYAQRVELDMTYASEWSLWLDIKIMVRTVRVVLTHDGSS